MGPGFRYKAADQLAKAAQYSWLHDDRSPIAGWKEPPPVSASLVSLRLPRQKNSCGGADGSRPLTRSITSRSVYRYWQLCSLQIPAYSGCAVWYWNLPARWASRQRTSGMPTIVWPRSRAGVHEVLLSSSSSMRVRTPCSSTQADHKRRLTILIQNLICSQTSPVW